MFDPIADAVEALRGGSFVVVVDDEDRENEGDLVLAGQGATSEAIAFMVRHTSGLLCAPMLGERLDRLGLPPMVQENSDKHSTAFTVSVDLRVGTTTGISAADRAATIRALADATVSADAFARPGHVFPLRYQEGGVLKRAGHTEASIDLLNLAGCAPTAVIAEIVDDDGSMARVPRLREFAWEHGFPMVSIADLVRYRSRREKLVRRVASARIPTGPAEFVGHVYRSEIDGVEHAAIVLGDVQGEEPALVRVHSECLTGDVFGSARCDCGAQLAASIEGIVEHGSGVVVYLRGHEERGIGLAHKLRAYALQDGGLDTVDANRHLGLPVDSREYGIGAQILLDLGVQRLRLLTNNPAKYRGLAGYGIEILDRIPLVTDPTPHNVAYLRTKQERMGHLLGALPNQA